MQQVAPPEQIRYLRGLLSKAQTAEFVDEAQVAQFETQLKAAEDAYNQILELMQVIQPIYTELQPQVTDTIHAGALVKNGRVPATVDEG